jgi:hypothetical protein
MALARNMIASVQPRWGRAASWLPWACGALLAAWCYVVMIVAARVNILGRFDDGIEYTTVTYLLHGQLPYTDFYEPYGIGLGIPGVLPHIVGIDGAFAMRLVYGLFPALVTLLVTPFVWRRCGPAMGVLVGLMTLTSTTPRYSMGFAALFGFALIVDRAVQSTSRRTLQEAAEEHPRLLLLASAVCSLAGWARTEYAIFAVLWAVVLVLVLPRGRRRWTLSLATVLLAALPTLIVFVTGGARHLWWFVSYTLSSSQSGFHAQRGHPVEWGLLDDRLRELLHFHLGASTPGTVVGSYGLALVVVVVGVAMLLVPRWRERLLARDRSYLTPFMVAVCAVVLYGQAARFSTTYGSIGNPVFWVTGALLVGRLSAWAFVALCAFVALPFASGVSPDTIYDKWSSRPAVLNRVVVPGLNRVPIAEDGGAASMAALVAQWRALGLNGRPTVAVELRNDVAWGNEAIVGFLLDAPAAAWPLTYDPGLVNTAEVERATVAELCRNRAPVVQGDGDYPYPPGVKVDVGSRLLDEFLAINYEIIAVAGFYRVLLPSAAHCERPGELADRALEVLGVKWLEQGELAAAGALAIARLERAHERHRPPSASNAALAALGGYTLTAAELPAGGLGRALRALASTNPHVADLATAAARPWPSDVQRLAAQTAWIAHRTPGEAATAQAAAAVYSLALRHPSWPQAILNLSAVQPPSRDLFARLAREGAMGMPAFDRWRRGYLVESGDVIGSISAGLALIDDYDRRRDPVEAGQVELELATYPGITPACASALRRDAGMRPGLRVLVAPGGPPCSQAPIADFLRSRTRLAISSTLYADAVLLRGRSAAAGVDGARGGAVSTSAPQLDSFDDFAFIRLRHGL